MEGCYRARRSRRSGLRYIAAGRLACGVACWLVEADGVQDRGGGSGETRATFCGAGLGPCRAPVAAGRRG
jgi:hypothetical protein